MPAFLSALVCTLRRLLSLGACLAWLALAAPAWAQPVMQIRAAHAHVDLAGQLQQLEDPSGQQTVGQVMASAAGWQRLDKPSLNWGYSRSAWWLRLAVRNDDQEPLSLVLDLQSPLHDYVSFHVLTPQGQVLRQIDTGDRRPFASRPLQFHGLALPLRLAPGEQVHVLVRIHTHDGWFEPFEPALLPVQTFTSHTEAVLLFQGLYFGSLLTLAGYNLFLWLSLRERVFGLYVAYLLSFGFWGLCYRGLAFEYLWPDSPRWGNMVMTVCGGLAMATALLFAVSYLRLRERAPRWLLRGALGIAGIELLLAAGAPLDHYALSWAVLLPVALVGTLGLCAVGLWQWWRGHREGMFYSLAFVPMLTGMASLILSTLNLLPPNSLGNSGWQLAALFEVMVLAFGLADSVQRMKAAKLAAERQAYQAQQALASRLEVQVQERTVALENANRKLHALSIVDELTGAYNRRHFNEVCRAALASPGRDEPLLLCMFDIDHFKDFNDLYGHQAGDHALAAVAQRVADQLRRSGDFLFRLGGEEFGVLVHARGADSAALFVEGLREAIKGLQITHSRHPAGVITASFGAVWWSGAAQQGLTPDAMYAAADQQLYLAKAGGRDCVRLQVLREAPQAATPAISPGP